MPRPAYLALACVAAAVVVAAMVARRDRPGGIGQVWALFGAADQGPVAFRTLHRRSWPNDALVCPSWLCTAVPDVAASLYALPSDALRARLASLILGNPDAVQVAEADGEHGDRFVIRTRWLRFPDTVDVLVLPQPEGRSTLAIYSRSLVGIGDGGTNRGRIRRWLADPVLRDAVRGTAAPAVDGPPACRDQAIRPLIGCTSTESGNTRVPSTVGERPRWSASMPLITARRSVVGFRSRCS